MSELESKLKHAKAILKSLLISSNKQFYTLKDLQRDYNDQRGTNIPFKELGFASILDFLKNIPDTIEICGTSEFIHLKAISNNKTNHITQLITNQKKPENKNSRNRKPFINRYSMGQKPQSTSQNPFIPHEIQDYVYNFLKDKPLGVPEAFLESQIRQNTQFNLDEMDGILGIINFCTLFKIKGGIVSLNSKNPTNPVITSSQTEKSDSLKIKSVIVDILKEYPQGLLCSRFSEIYKAKYRIPIDFGALGYTSLLQFLANMNDFLVLKKINQYDWLIVLKEFLKKELKISSDINLSKNKLQSADLKLSFSQESNLSSEQPDHADLKLSFSQESNLSSEQPDHADLKSSFSQDSNLSSENDSLTTNSLFVQQQKLSSVKEDILPIVITEIYSPTLFWVNLYSPQIITAFYDFFDNMQEYYKQNGSSMKITKSCWNKTKYVVAYYQNEWHRVLILNKQSDTSVNVFFIDSGTKMPIDLNTIFQMKEEFYQMPSQAICASLSNISIPSKLQHWPKESTSRFRDLVINKPLSVIIKSLDKEANSFSGVLVDTSTKKDIDINRRLIEERLADEEPNKSFDSLSSSSSVVSDSSNEKSFKHFEQLNKISTSPLIKHRITINPNFQIRLLNKITMGNPTKNMVNKHQKLKQIYLGLLTS